MTEQEQPLILTGRALAPGLGQGKTYIYNDVMTRVDEFHNIETQEVNRELKRFDQAIEAITGHLEALAEKVKEEIDAQLSDVFQAHIAMVRDAALRAEIEKELRQELVSAGAAVRTVFRRWERRFRSMEADTAQQKADDVRDLARRLISSMAGLGGHALENMAEGSVLVAPRLLPSDTIILARRRASGALLESGGAGSHAALFAHEIGLPCIAGLPGIVEQVAPEQWVLVDADAGEAVVRPNKEQRQAFVEKREQRDLAFNRARDRARLPAKTRDGRRIAVMANVGRVEDTREALNNGADGIGLYRIERIYLGRQEPPSKEELYEEIRQTLLPAQGLPVYVRLLDVGADKSLPFLESRRESNPALGRRGIRFLRDVPDLLQTQLQVLLQLADDFDLHILTPMVTLPGDLVFVEEQMRMAREHISGVKTRPQMGAMIETPAAALSVAALVAHAQFMSFGTNDLTQYTFATDRENAAVEPYFDDAHDAVFRLIDIARRDAPDRPFSVCGELASRPRHTERLLRYGIQTLSVAPPSIPAVKEAVRQA